MQTIAGNFLPRPNHLPEATTELVEVSAASGALIASEVLCQCHWQAKDVFGLAVCGGECEQALARGRECRADEHA